MVSFYLLRISPKIPFYGQNSVTWWASSSVLSGLMVYGKLCCRFSHWSSYFGSLHRLGFRQACCLRPELTMHEELFERKCNCTLASMKLSLNDNEIEINIVFPLHGIFGLPNNSFIDMAL